MGTREAPGKDVHLRIEYRGAYVHLGYMPLVDAVIKNEEAIKSLLKPNIDKLVDSGIQDKIDSTSVQYQDKIHTYELLLNRLKKLGYGTNK